MDFPPALGNNPDIAVDMPLAASQPGQIFGGPQKRPHLPQLISGLCKAGYLPFQLFVCRLSDHATPLIAWLFPYGEHLEEKQEENLCSRTYTPHPIVLTSLGNLFSNKREALLHKFRVKIRQLRYYHISHLYVNSSFSSGKDITGYHLVLSAER
jgi:hypothetical protein